MNSEKRAELLTRDSILKLLSDEEIAHVSTAETAAGLTKGEEYLDLERLAEGVQVAGAAVPSMGNVLPRKAVHLATWDQILTRLKSYS